jgi:hypothetical protein
MSWHTRWLRAMPLALLVGAVVPAAPAQAYSTCVTTLVTACSFTCHPGDVVTIEVGGAGAVGGAAGCPGAGAVCGASTYCTASSGSTASAGTGFCDLFTGQWARCSAGSPLSAAADVLDPLCAVTESFCNVLPGDDAIVCPVLASQPGAYGPVTIDPEGDVWVAGEKVRDCPPYDS